MDQPPNRPDGDGHEPDRRSPPWPVIVLPVVWLVLGLGAGIGIIRWVSADDAVTSTANVSSQGPSSKASATAKKKATKTKATAEPTTEPTTEPTATRSIGVSVYNQIGIRGLARRVAGELQTAGWTIGAVSDWRGSVPQDTIYFPAGRQGEAELLGQDLSVTRIMPAIANMSTTHLTVVLASPR